MGFYKKRMIPTKKSTVIIFSLSIALMFVSYLVIQSIVMQIELRDFTASIQEDTKENLISAKNFLDGMVTDLDNTARQMLKYDDLEQPEVKAVLEFSHKLNLFDETFVSDINGNAYNHFGYKFSVADQEYFLRAMKEKKVVFSGILPSKQFGAVQIIAFPLLSDEQEQKGVLFGLFAVDTFSHLIENVVDHKKDIYIVESNGNYINCFNEDQIKIDRGNFWNKLEKQQLRNMTVDELKKQFQAGKEGEFFFGIEELNTSRYGYHMPLGIQDWQIVLTVEKTAVNAHIQSIRRVDTMHLIADAICLTTMLMCIYSYFKRTNSEITSVNQEISKNNEMLQMAVEHTNHIIFEYDIDKKAIELKTSISDLPFKDSTILDVPDSILATNTISEDSIAMVKKLFETIENEKSSSADIQIVKQNHEKIWYRVQMYNLYDEKGSIVGTVGNAQDISVIKKGEDAIKRKNEMYRSVLANALLYARVKLNTGIVSELNGEDTKIPYQSYLEKLIDEYVIDEHYSYVSQMLSIESLREGYRQGKKFIEVEYIIKDQQSFKWVSCIVHQVNISNSDKVTFLVRDIDQKKRQEIALKAQAERDGLTGLYNAITTRAKINEVLINKHELQGNHIFILFDLDNFKKINDSFGHACGDQVLIDVANVLKDRFRSSDILGRLGGDEFAVMIFDVRSDRYITHLMEGLKQDLTKKYTQGDLTVELSASTGLALAPNDGTTFEELYEKADKALYQVKKEGKNGYRRYE